MTVLEQAPMRGAGRAIVKRQGSWLSEDAGVPRVDTHDTSITLFRSDALQLGNARFNFFGLDTFRGVV